MKIFNGRLATEDYMSTHSLTFSTPEMTLKKFAIWLGERVNDPKTNQSSPRLLLYLEDKSNSGTVLNEKTLTSNYLPDIDDTFKPTGAISDLYGDVKKTKIENTQSGTEKRFCINCGVNIKPTSKFCNKCGFIQ